MTPRTAFIEVVLEEPGTRKPMKNIGVTVELNVAAFADSGRVNKIGRRVFTTDDTGLLKDPDAGTLPELELNDDLDPAGTWYTMRIPGLKNLWTFQLTAVAAGQTVKLRDELVAGPLNPYPLVFGQAIAMLHDNGDGTWTITGQGVTDNGDGTFTIAA